jgi:membrane protein
MAVLPNILKFIKEFFHEFKLNRVPKLAAALAFYTILSLPALLLIVMRLSDVFYGHQAVEGKIYEGLVDLIGSQGASQVQQAVQTVSVSADNYFAMIVGIITLFFGATGIFVEIQDSINHVWHIRAKPRKGRGILKMLLNRILSFSMIAVLAFLLLVSLIANSLMDILLEKLYTSFPHMEIVLVYIFNMVIAFLVTAFLILVIFKVLPDARLHWKDVRVGVVVTTLVFMAGKFLISYYLGRNKLSSAYGAAGSLIILLFWVTLCIADHIFNPIHMPCGLKEKKWKQIRNCERKFAKAGGERLP